MTTAMGMASPHGRRGRLSIFIFHRVLPKPDPLFPEELDASRFARILEWISSWFNILPLDVALKHLLSGELPARAAAITFDDGYMDNYTIARPILEQLGLSATFFIATGFVEHGCMWNDQIIAAVRECTTEIFDLDDLGLGRHPLTSIKVRRRAIDDLIGRTKYLPGSARQAIGEAILGRSRVASPHNLMMSADAIRAMRASGMQIGAHTISHPILAHVAKEEAAHEITGGKRWLEDTLQAPVELFAYPNGKPNLDFLREHVEIVRAAGFIGAVSTAPGAAAVEDDPLQLPRFTPWDRDRARFGMRSLANLFVATNVAT